MASAESISWIVLSAIHAQTVLSEPVTVEAER